MKEFKKYWILWAALFCLSVLYLGFLFFQQSHVISVPKHPGSIIAFGDGYTSGIGASSKEKSYPAVLSQLLGEEVLNLGREDDTSYDLMQRLAAEVLPKTPRIVILTVGVRDEKIGIPMETTMANISAIVQELQKSGAMVVNAAIDPPSGGWLFQYLKAQNRDMAVLHVPDILDGVWDRPEQMSDKEYPNDAGYRIMAERLKQAVQPYLSVLK